MSRGLWLRPLLADEGARAERPPARPNKPRFQKPPTGESGGEPQILGSRGPSLVSPGSNGHSSKAPARDAEGRGPAMSRKKLGWHPAWSMSERQWMLYEEKLAGSEVPVGT